MPDIAISGIAADEAAGTEYDIINQSIGGGFVVLA